MTGLRRTGLARRSELKRSPMPRRRAAMRARALKSISRQARATGPTAGQRRLVAARAGYQCEVCAVHLADGDQQWTRPHSFHHRQPRGAGGSRRPEVNSPANLLLLCGSGVTGCHGRIESKRAEAYAAGWLVHAQVDPTTRPVMVRGWRVLLTVDGRYEAAA